MRCTPRPSACENPASSCSGSRACAPVSWGTGARIPGMWCVRFLCASTYMVMLESIKRAWQRAAIRSQNEWSHVRNKAAARYPCCCFFFLLSGSQISGSLTRSLFQYGDLHFWFLQTLGHNRDIVSVSRRGHCMVPQFLQRLISTVIFSMRIMCVWWIYVLSHIWVKVCVG